MMVDAGHGKPITLDAASTVKDRVRRDHVFKRTLISEIAAMEKAGETVVAEAMRKQFLGDDSQGLRKTCG